MPREDATDPGRQNPLAFIGVSELDCQERTKELTGKIDTVQSTLNTYLVKQKGKAEGIASVFRWGKWILIIGGLLSLLWAAVSFLEMKAESIAKANGYHQPRPTVDYAYDLDIEPEEDP